MPFSAFIKRDSIMILLFVFGDFYCPKHFILIFDSGECSLDIFWFQFHIKLHNIFFFYTMFWMFVFIDQCRIISQKK